MSGVFKPFYLKPTFFLDCLSTQINESNMVTVYSLFMEVYEQYNKLLHNVTWNKHTGSLILRSLSSQKCFMAESQNISFYEIIMYEKWNWMYRNILKELETGEPRNTKLPSSVSNLTQLINRFKQTDVKICCWSTFWWRTQTVSNAQIHIDICRLELVTVTHITYMLMSPFISRF